MLKVTRGGKTNKAPIRELQKLRTMLFILCEKLFKLLVLKI